MYFCLFLRSYKAIAKHCRDMKSKRIAHMWPQYTVFGLYVGICISLHKVSLKKLFRMKKYILENTLQCPVTS